MADTKTGKSGWLMPAAALLGGLALGYVLFGGGTAAPTSTALTVPTGPAPAAGYAEQEVELYRQINADFVAQLRRYHTRLREIADVAEAEGAATGAKQMRDFALETELLIERYDKIVKARQ